MNARLLTTDVLVCTAPLLLLFRPPVFVGIVLATELRLRGIRRATSPLVFTAPSGFFGRPSPPPVFTLDLAVVGVRLRDYLWAILLVRAIGATRGTITVVLD